jgi:hypothetical protein
LSSLVTEATATGLVDFHPAAIGRHLAAIVLGEQDAIAQRQASPVLVVRESA